MQMDGITGALKTLFGNLNGWSSYLLAVAGLGTLTMAILQAFKDITPVRRWFQRARMRSWLSEQAQLAHDNGHVPLNADQVDLEQKKLAQVNPTVRSMAVKAEGELLELATNGDSSAFYDLEIEKLCGQWNAAIQIVIDYPGYAANLFGCMAARASEADCEKVRDPNIPPQLSPNAESQFDDVEQARRIGARQAFLDARIRVMHQIQRAVDSFQIATAFRWKWHFQVASFGVSFLLAMIAELVAGSSAYGAAIVSAAIAGFLAPVARDLLAAIQKLREP
jgi:hypothetical protein